VLTGLRRSLQFAGRASRAEYWYLNLFTIVGSIVLFVAASATDSDVLYTVVLVFYVGTILPLVSASVRRLHDAGHSGFFLLLTLVPFGGLVVLYFVLQRSDPGTNRFGAHPLA